MTPETILLVALVALAAWPAARLVHPARLTPRGLALGLTGLAIAVACGFMLVGNTESLQAIDPETSDRPMAIPSQGYISSENCRSCHPHQYSTWHRSYHRTMTTVASPETTKGDFDNATVEVDGSVFRMTRKDDEFWMEMDDPDHPTSAAEKPPRIDRQIRMITGSHHLQFYWTTTGRTRELVMLPMVYNLGDKTWVPFGATLLRPPDEPDAHVPGLWNKVCIQCHTTFAQPKVMGESEMYSEVSEFGISCEACHGPAENHVEVNQDMMTRYRRRLAGEKDDSVVEPTQLASKVDSQVCGQCHSVNRAGRRSVWDEYLRNGFAYRPGGEVEPERMFPRLSYTNIINEILKTDPYYVIDNFWPDGMVRVAGREYNGLIESPCYQHDDDAKRLSCFSCHEMHPDDTDPRSLDEWANDQLKPDAGGDQACLQCHQDYAKDISAHTRHAPNSSGSRCYNCHMPHTTYGLLKGIRSHQVSSPSAQESVEVGRPNACNLCHLDQTLEWTGAKLEEWHQIDKPQLKPEQKEVAASVLWLTQGDAAQRALTAWHMGWKPALEASGADWVAPHLARQLDDPYNAVRYISARSLKGLPGYEDWNYNYVGPVEKRREAASVALDRWSGSFRENVEKKRLLIGSDGKFDEASYSRLLQYRDNTPINMAE